jgi:uncharacterized membrane protein
MTFRIRSNAILIGVCLLLSLLLYILPNDFEKHVDPNAVRARGLILETDNTQIQQLGMIKKGHQEVRLRILDGPYKDQEFTATNQLMGRLDLDKIYQAGDVSLVVLTRTGDGKIIYVNPQDHHRLGMELLLLGLFALLLVIFGGWTGLKALLSFIFAALMIWKVIVPLFLKGWDPIFLSLAAVALMTAVIIFLVAGPGRKGITAFGGAFAGVLTSCLLAWYFTGRLHLHGAVLPFAETLLYSGYGHLDLARIYVAAVFFAASGAVMDLAMDVAASQEELWLRNPGLSRMEMLTSGFRVGRAVVGTMTTTLLLAYSGGYITLLMAFMAQGVPLANMFNLIFVAAEVLKTLVGSFGLVTVAPFTAIIGAMVFGQARGSKT